MRCFIALGVVVACCQFIYLARVLSSQGGEALRGGDDGEKGSYDDRPQPAVQEQRASLHFAVAPPPEQRKERLRKRGHFAVPEQAAEATREHRAEAPKAGLEEKKGFVEEESFFSREKASSLGSSLALRVAAREELLERFVREIHLSFRSLRPAEGFFGVKNSRERVSDAKVWETFHDVVSRLLYETPEFLELRRHQRRSSSLSSSSSSSSSSIFVSVSSFRDEACPATLAHMYDEALEPLKIAVGVVQQNCDEEQHRRFGCFTAVMPEDMKVHAAAADVDCADAFCGLRPALCATLKSRGLLRVLRFNESETFGPVFGRYLGSMLWTEKESFYAQVDAHTTFAKHWDKTLLEDYALSPALPGKAVFSHYPPSGPQVPGPLPNNKKYAWDGAPGTCMCEAAFAEYDIVRVGAMQRYPFKEYSPPGCDPNQKSPNCRRVPRFAPYVGAGFVFANASFLYDVPFDPFLPFAFMGEELDFSTRLWTAGYDIFCPPRSVLAHAYLRPQKPKFWGALQRSIGAGAHNSLQKYILPRIKHKVGYPEAKTLSPASLTDHLDDFGLGTARPLADYLRIADLDFIHKRNAKVNWCKTGDRPPTAPPPPPGDEHNHDDHLREEPRLAVAVAQNHHRRH